MAITIGQRDAGRYPARASRLRIGRLIATYVVIAALWIVASDIALERLWPQGAQTLFASIFKGLAFVLVTGGVLYFYLRREHGRMSVRAARHVATVAALLEHFRALSERVSDAVLLVDEQDRIIEVNDAAVDTFGWPRATLCQRTVRQLEVDFTPARGNRRSTVYEATFRLADGRMLPVEVDVLELRVGSRRLRQFLVRSVAALEDTAAGHRDRTWVDVFFDMPFIGMAVSSPASKRWVRFNDRLCEILGYSRAEVEGLSWADITHPDDLDKDVRQFERVLQGEIDDYRLDKRFIRKDGSIVHVEIDVRCRRLADGSVDYLVATIQDVTERIMAEERLRRQKNLYRALSQINAAITRLPDRQGIFQDLCDAVVGVGRFSFAFVCCVTEEGGDLHLAAQAGDDHDYIAQVLEASRSVAHRKSSALREVLRTGQPVVWDPYLDDPRKTPWRSAAAASGVAASGAFPIVDQGQVVGVLKVYARHSGEFDQDVVQLIEEMARDVSFALENHRREEARTETLKALQVSEARARFALEGAGHAAWEWDLGTNRVSYSPRWKAMLGFGEGEISDSPDEWTSRIHPDDRQATLAGIAAHLAGRTSGYSSEHRLRCKDGSYKWVLDRGQIMEWSGSGQPLRVFGTKTDLTETKATEERLRQEGRRMELARASARIGTWDYDIVARTVHLHHGTPLLFGFDEQPRSLSLDEYFALLHPDDRELLAEQVELHLREGGDYFSRFRFIWPDGSVHWIEDRGVIHCDGDGRPVSAYGINMDVTERVESERKISEYITRLERSMLGTVDAISHMVDLRDPYTAGHEARVARLAAAIGRELGLDETSCQGLEIIGRVHDIGKITIPAEILSKPGRLSEMEMNIVRTHAQQGYEILKDIDFDWPVAEVIRQHHERLDGSGYPRGLRGEEIMLEARIIAVADVVESMASHRPYRPARGIELALAEIQANIGRLYDAEVVRACLKLFRECGFRLDGESDHHGKAD